MALEARRFEALRLVSQGITQTEVARRLNVSRQNVGRWMSTKRVLGEQAPRKSSQVGRGRQLNPEQRDMLAKMLCGPPEAGV